MEVLQLLLSGSFGAGLTAIVLACLQRYWKKKDDGNDMIKALVVAQKIMMLDRVQYMGQKYIDEGEISLRDKDTLKEMHKAYKGLGGNGHLDTVMSEVEKLPIAGAKHEEDND